MIVRLFFFSVVCSLIFCSYEVSELISSDDIVFLEKRLTNSSQIIHEPSSWPANRRYFFLIRIFAQMGVRRCDHFLPAEDCFVNRHKKINKNQQVLLSEKILVQPQVNQNNSKINSFLIPQKTKYTYFYKTHDSIRNLKNIIITSTQKMASGQEMGIKKKKKSTNLLIFDYLRNEPVIINRIIAFMELFHYFSKQCKLKMRTIAFVEGEFALEYLLKKMVLINDSKFSQKKRSFLLENFAKEGYLFIKNDKIKVNSFLVQRERDELMKLTDKKKSFFCQ